LSYTHQPEQLKVREAALLERAGEEDFDEDGAGLSAKSARAYAKTYKIGPPLVPAKIVDNIIAYIAKVNMSQKNAKRDFVVQVCKYWSLKREARRGAPLLKRLHLEPWSAGNRQQSDQEKATKLEVHSLLVPFVII
jgi:hypothetical protein